LKSKQHEKQVFARAVRGRSARKPGQGTAGLQKFSKIKGFERLQSCKMNKGSKLHCEYAGNIEIRLMQKSFNTGQKQPLSWVFFFGVYMLNSKLQFSRPRCFSKALKTQGFRLMKRLLRALKPANHSRGEKLCFLKGKIDNSEQMFV
jgi:hypothetical protein